MLFLENEVQMNQNNYRTMLFMSEQVSLPKISFMLQKLKISLKFDIRPCVDPTSFLNGAADVIMHRTRYRTKGKQGTKESFASWTKG